MWAQLVKFYVKPGTEAQVKDMIDYLIATAQPDSDLLQVLAISDQRDPTSVVVAR
jgi:hypothetical protein